MSRRLLDPAEIQAALAERPGWTAREGKLGRTFEFPSFGAAMAFMAAVAADAERLEHHPDWSNSYRTVRVELTTHSAGGLTILDFQLAAAMDAAFARAGA